ncbi:hypothetical protein E3P99_01929 [Wallemia hederae]|uniref:Dihydroxyacetone kinase n=1 Tax=Wallemia hederae TaxID=1540922 RepID=A0A4V6TMD9_9BASI|nr:hypothetical protein E3P99_01929 [Wallemia hederae]
MSTKHIFDSQSIALDNALRSANALNPTLCVDIPRGIVYDTRPPSPHRSVSVVAGGGSGHNPCHENLVGKGLLQASVSGHIFASPSSSQIVQAIERTPSHHAILLIINQYTGDRLNFNLAAQRARHTGRIVHTVTVGDDVSLPPTAIAKVGRRGLTANPLTCKVAAAAAERGLDIDSVRRIAEAVAQNVATIGASPEHCHLPGRSAAEAHTHPDTYVELGLGIHNEPGAKTVKDDTSPTKLIGDMLRSTLTSPYVDFKDGDKVILVVNNLGGLSLLELYAVVGVASDLLSKEHNMKPMRTLADSFMTSLNMPGFSLSLVNVTAADGLVRDTGVSILELLHDPTTVSAWPEMGGTLSDYESAGCMKHEGLVRRDAKMQEHSPPHRMVQAVPSTQDTSTRRQLIAAIITSACDAVLAVEPDLTRWDTVAGDGDCGTTLSSGATALKGALQRDEIPLHSYKELFHALSIVVETSMGGTAGALFALYFGAFANAVEEDVADGARKALDQLKLFTSARVGDRTLMDALIPFCNHLNHGVMYAAQQATKGAENTATMTATLGRAAYCTGNDDSLTVPDPGATGVSAILMGIAECFQN